MNILSILLKLDLKPSIISTTTTNLSEIIGTFKDHRSVKNIFSLRREGCQFKFHSVSENEARKVILNMDEKKGEPNW